MVGKITEEFMERLRELESDKEYWKSLTPDSPEVVELREMIGLGGERQTKKVDIKTDVLEVVRKYKGLGREELSDLLGRYPYWYRDTLHKGYMTVRNANKLAGILDIDKEKIIKE